MKRSKSFGRAGMIMAVLFTAVIVCGQHASAGVKEEKAAAKKAEKILKAAKAMQSKATDEVMTISSIDDINAKTGGGIKLDEGQTAKVDVSKKGTSATVAWGDKAICIDENGKACCSSGVCEGYPLCGSE